MIAIPIAAIFLLACPQDEGSRQARALIERLRSDKVDEREDATRKLIDLGEMALPALEEAARSKDPEVVARARRVVEIIVSHRAEQTFKRIEESLSISKTATVTFRASNEQKDSDTKLRGEGTILLKEGNKVRMSVKGSGAGPETEVLIVSDGSKMFSRNPREQRSESPKNLVEVASFAVARLGAEGSFGFIGFFIDDEESRRWDVKKTLPVSDFKEGPPDGSAKTLTYKVKFLESTSEVRLWYDPKTYALRKRVMNVRAVSGESTMTETYEEFVLGSEIPDDKFNLPEKK